MIIRAPEQRDIPRLRKLWQEAFGDGEDFLDGFFSAGFSPSRCRLVELQGRPAAVLYWFDCAFCGKKLAYIYGVATDKACRGQGLCRGLMIHTHEQLRALGYSAAVLVPGNQKLFSMYDKLGYRAFCPMHFAEISEGHRPFPVKELSACAYFSRRQTLLPDGGIAQESVGEFLSLFAEFYGGEDWIACLTRENEILCFQEFLGDEAKLPGIVKTLGAVSAKLYLPGGEPRAMYCSLDGTELDGAYLGISLG